MRNHWHGKRLTPMKRQYEDFFMKNSARKESLKKHLTPTRESVKYAAQADDLASTATKRKIDSFGISTLFNNLNKKSVWTFTGIELFEIVFLFFGM